jgi:protein O-GlcNAc transferase
LGRFDEAVGVYDRILSLDPGYETNIQALQGKASGLFNLGSYDDAIAVYDKILSIVPNMVVKVMLFSIWEDMMML